jgi:antitoxin MazE
MKIKHLTRVGNSSALIIDRPILDVVGIDEQTPLKLSIEGRRIVIEPMSEEETEKRFGKAADKVERRFGKMFKRLAQ